MKAKAPSAGGTMVSISGRGVRSSAFLADNRLLSAPESTEGGKTPCRLVPGPRKEGSEPVSDILVSLFGAVLESLLPPSLPEAFFSPGFSLVPPMSVFEARH